MRLWNEIHKVVTAFSARKVRVFVGLMVFAMGILSSLQIRAATVYWAKEHRCYSNRGAAEY